MREKRHQSVRPRQEEITEREKGVPVGPLLVCALRTVAVVVVSRSVAGPLVSFSSLRELPKRGIQYIYI